MKPPKNIEKDKILRLPEAFRIDFAFNRLKDKIEKNKSMESDESRLLLFI